MDEARRCSDILTQTRRDRDERCPWTPKGEPKKPMTADPYQMNLAVMNARIALEAAARVNRENIRLVWEHP
jgi:hypothetical protein